MKITRHNEIIWYGWSWIAFDLSWYVIDSGQPWDRVAVQSGLHWWEVTHRIVKDIYERAKKNLKKGSIVIIPLANPMWWNQRLYFSTVGKFELHTGKDPNRLFPWDENGSIWERLCNVLIKIVDGSDLVLDLHTSRKSVPFCMIVNDRQLLLAQLMWLDFTYYCPIDIRCFTDYLTNIGTESFTVECGSHDNFNLENIEKVSDWIKNILVYKGMVDGNYKKSDNCQYFYGHKKIVTDVGWIINYIKNIWDRFYKGDLLFVITHPVNLEESKQVFAEEDWVVYKINPSHISWTGDELLAYIASDDLKKISVL